MLSQKQKWSGPSSSAFLYLPRELRDQIYRELLLQELVWDEQSGRFNIQTSILRVSTQIKNEASRILYKENCWVLFETNYNGRCVADFVPNDRSTLGQHCQPLVSSKHLASFPQDPFLRVRVMKGCSMINLAYFLTTPEGLRGICKFFTSQDSRLVELTLHFNTAGRLREQLLSSAFEAFHEARGIGTASVFGLAAFSKGHQLAKFMKTRIKNLEELSAQASIFESRGDHSMQIKDFRTALREYSLGQDYATWIHGYLADMRYNDMIAFTGDSMFDPAEKELFFMNAKVLCLLNCGQTVKASTTLLQCFDCRTIFGSEAGKAIFYGGLIALDKGNTIGAIHVFIMALHCRHGTNHQISQEATSVEALLDGDLSPCLSTTFYYRRLLELFKRGAETHVGRHSTPWKGHTDYPALLSWHARHELREGTTSNLP